MDFQQALLSLPEMPATLTVEAVYSETYIYYMNMWSTTLFLLVMPFLQVFTFDSFNQWKTVNMIWFFIEFVLGIYSMVLILGSESI